ncbi:MAG: hypothetical protein ACYDH8_10855 [Syntrophales bacterium]
MILGKIKQRLNEHLHTDQINKQAQELMWAHIYHDSIRGKKWLEELSIYPGRWAASYSFLYVLVRILADYQPKKIIEFGLGETSKIISKFIENGLTEVKHVIIEQSRDWSNGFVSRFPLSQNSQIIQLEVTEKIVNQFIVKSYNGIDGIINEIFDLYIIDGPLGSDRYSRYDICLLAQKFQPKDEFMVILDDYQRAGEQDTIRDLVELLRDKGINIYTGIYSGIKDQFVIGTEKYRYISSL